MILLLSVKRGSDGEGKKSAKNMLKKHYVRRLRPLLTRRGRQFQADLTASVATQCNVHGFN